MPPNFEFLKNKTEYSLFSRAAIDAENTLTVSPSMTAVGARKALELAVKWVYSADNTMTEPYKNNLQALIHEPSFKLAVDEQTWRKFRFIIELGNLAVHTERSISHTNAVYSLTALFEFIQWIDYCYGDNYVERSFNESLIPSVNKSVDETLLKEKESLLQQKDSEIEKLRAIIAANSNTYAENKAEYKSERTFVAADTSEYETRKRFIDIDLIALG